MTTVALPIENKVRELDGKLWLGLNLIHRGYNVILGPSWEIKSVLDIIKPDIYITKDTGDGNIPYIKKLQQGGIIVCGLSPESAVNSEIEYYADHKKEVINVFDAYFAWGEAPAKALRSRYDGSISTLNITGNPRFDLLVGDLRNIYSERGKEIQKRYGDYILVNSNFTIGNPTNREKLYELVEKNAPDRDLYQEEIEYKRILHSFVELLMYLSSKGHNIILRPHPGENHTTYHRIFEYVDNIEVVHEGGVRSWIFGADGVIHYDCTTGIEAALMETPVLSYQPLSDISRNRSLSQIVSYTATTREQVLDWVTESINSGAQYQINAEQKSELKKYFPNIDHLAAPKICDIIDGLVGTSNGYSEYDLSFETKIERMIRSSPIGPNLLEIHDRVNDQILGKDKKSMRKRQKQKFPGLEKEEIMKQAQKMSEQIGGNNVKINKVPRTNHTYRMSLK